LSFRNNVLHEKATATVLGAQPPLVSPAFHRIAADAITLLQRPGLFSPAWVSRSEELPVAVSFYLAKGRAAASVIFSMQTFMLRFFKFLLSDNTIWSSSSSGRVDGEVSRAFRSNRSRSIIGVWAARQTKNNVRQGKKRA